MFGMTLTGPSLTTQLTSGVLAHVYGQKADTSNKYCDNIQPYDKRRFSFYQTWHNFQIVFFGNYHKFELSKIMRQHCGEICWKFSSLSCSERIVKLSVDKVISMSLVYYFLGHSVESLLKTAWSYVHLSWLNVSVWQTTRRLYALCIAVLMLARV